MGKTISLSCELGELAHVVDGARLLCEGMSRRELEGAAGRTLASTLTLIVARMRDIGAAIRGELDPGRLWAEHNCGALGAADRDIVLRAWPRPLARPRRPGRRSKTPAR